MVTKRRDYYIITFQADLSVVKRAVSRILSYFSKCLTNLSEDTRLELRLVVTELLVNAVEHGGKGDARHKIKVVAGVTTDEYALVVVEDDGDGYDTSKIDHCKASDISFDSIESLSETGRGIFLVKNLCEDFMVNEKGNKVVINKKLTTV